MHAGHLSRTVKPANAQITGPAETACLIDQLRAAVDLTAADAAAASV